MAQHSSDFSKTSEEILLDLINDQNHLNLPITAVSITKAEDLPAGRSTANVVSTQGSGYRGGSVINYAQVNIGVATPSLLRLTDPFQWTSEEPPTLTGILNKAMSVQLKPEDIEILEGSPTPIDGFVVNTMKIRATDQSLIWDGEVSVEIHGYLDADIQYYSVYVSTAPAGYGAVNSKDVRVSEDNKVLLSEDGKIIING